MRVFLHEPSTPWIVFDRDDRPPSQVAPVEVAFRAALSSLMPEHGFFPATAIVDAAYASTVKEEPSSLAVAADLDEDAVPADLGSSGIPMQRLSRRVLGTACALVAVASIAAVITVWPKATDNDMLSARAAARGTPTPAAALAPDVTVKPSAQVVAPPVRTAPAPARTDGATAPVPAKPSVKGAAAGFGHLSIGGDARWRDVFLDGKRLLGRGARTFTVFCGTHSIAVGAKANAQDLDVPCSGELVVTK